MGARAFTLVELLVVMGVIALMGVLAVPALEGVTGANARRSASELAGSMRALFDTAALRHATCRLVLDLEKNAYWAECAPGRAGIGADPSKEPDDEKLKERFADEKDAEVRRLLARSKFGVYQDRILRKHELSGSTKFGPVHLEGRRESLEAGSALVYFFPGGQAQKAWVPVVDGNTVYTVVLEPYTGRARVVPGTVEVRE